MILLTGGAGYIGSHMLAALLDSSKDVVVLDNLSTGDIDRVTHVCRVNNGAGSVAFVEGDIRDAALLNHLFDAYPITAVLHLAGLKSISGSTKDPNAYHDNNVTGSAVLLSAMIRAGVKTMLFSSSMSVYQHTSGLPVDESTPTHPNNPYSQSKLDFDNMLAAAADGDDTLRLASIRYANPIGTNCPALLDKSQDNLLPTLSRVIAGKQRALTVFGGDYATVDGTAVRDYIHVNDVISAHLSALTYLKRHSGHHVWNIGSGSSWSVMQIIGMFEHASGKHVRYEIKGARTGDCAAMYVDCIKAAHDLNWQPQHSVFKAVYSHAVNHNLTAYD